MPAAEPFAKVHDSDKLLSEICGHYYVDESNDQMLVALEFRFKDELVSVVALEDDSFEVHQGKWQMKEKGLLVKCLNHDPPWNLAVGNQLDWSWRMVNQQGYFDGIQLQFRGDGGFPPRIQLVVVASEIKVATLGAR